MNSTTEAARRMPHHDVERAQGPRRTQRALDDRAEGQPDEAARQRSSTKMAQLGHALQRVVVLVAGLGARVARSPAAASTHQLA